MRTFLPSSVLFGLWLGWCGVSHAEVIPPRLVESPAIPSAHGTVPAPGKVLLEIVLDEQGRVGEVSVISGLGEPYDTEVVAAIKQARFEPARDEDRAIPARIRLEFSIGSTTPEAGVPSGIATERAGQPAQAPPQAGTSPPSHAPSGSTSSASPATPPSSAATAHAQPTRPTNPSNPPKQSPTSLSINDPSIAGEDSTSGEFGAVARIEAPSESIAERKVSAEQLRQVAGASGDVLRAIETRPGVTQGGDLGSAPLLRGAEWNESLVLVADVPIPLLYHMGGVKSAYNSILVDRVEATPSNYQIRYGRALGGVVNLVPRAPRLDQLHARLELSLLDSSALVEAPLGATTGMALAARRSNIDLVFRSLADEANFKTVAAPLYWDYQAMVHSQLGPHHVLSLHGFGARDGAELIMDRPLPEDPSIRGKMAAYLQAHRVGGILQSQLGGGVTQRLSVMLGRSSGRYQSGPLLSDYGQTDLFLRGDWRIPCTSNLSLLFGVDHETMRLSGVYEGTSIPQAEGDPNVDTPSEGQATVRYEGKMWRHQPAGFAGLTWLPHPKVTVAPGIRADYDNRTEMASIDPRLQVRYQVAASTALKWGLGQYSQPPMYYETLERIGNPGLRPTRAIHVGTGIEQRVGQLLELGLDGFAKFVRSRVVATPNGVPPNFMNQGKGRIWGGEVWAAFNYRSTSATLAYTLTYSRRQDRDEPWRRSETEQPHVLVLAANQGLGRKWTLGTRYRLASGTPLTPVERAVHDAGSGIYRPVFGAPLSQRNPTQQQLDIRLAKEFNIDPVKLTAFIDVQNVTNAENPDGYAYSYDYVKRESVSGLPLFPNLGISGEL